jgi:hypothetical protein
LQRDIVRVLADVGPQADWILVFFAVIIGVFALLFVLVTCVTIFTSDSEQRKTCHAILRDLLRSFNQRSNR